MSKRKAMCALLLTALFLFGCNPVPTEEPRVPASIVGPVVPTGPSEVRGLDPTTEIVPNCGGGGATIVKHPSMSVLTSHAVEWEVGGETGIGVRVGDGPIPGGVDLSAALDTHLKGGFESGVQQSTAWDLPAEPNTVMEYTLMWREVWQPGYIEVQLEDKSIKRVNVRYRAGIQSEIIGQRRLSCDGEQSIAPQPTTNFLTPALVTPTDIPLSSRCPDYVPRSKIQQWSVGEIGKDEVQSYLDAFESGRTGGGFGEGDSIPAGVVIATDFGNGESYIWKTLPVSPIAHYHSWGLFETLAEYQAPSAGSCKTIIP
jgi:hypothetical protein